MLLWMLIKLTFIINIKNALHLHVLIPAKHQLKLVPRLPKFLHCTLLACFTLCHLLNHCNPGAITKYINSQSCSQQALDTLIQPLTFGLVLPFSCHKKDTLHQPLSIGLVLPLSASSPQTSAQSSLPSQSSDSL